MNWNFLTRPYFFNRLSLLFFISLFCLSSLLSQVVAASEISVINTPQGFDNSSRHIMPGELLVKFKRPLSSGASRSKARRYKAQSTSHLSRLGISLWTIDASQSLQQVIEELKKDPNVAIVEPNYRRYPRAIRGYSTTDSTYPQNINRFNDLNLPKLLAKPKIHSRVKVAVIDDAFDINHDDVKDNIYMPFDALDKDDNPSPELCMNPLTNEPAIDPSTNKTFFEAHGTLVMGVVGAVSHNNAQVDGIDGAADNAFIIPIRVSCNYNVGAVARAFEYAIDQDVDIINISWGGPQFSLIEKELIKEAQNENILIVAAAGNEDADNDRVLDYPSSLDLPNILSVAAITEEKKLAEWTQYGQTSVDIAAPGVAITTLARENKIEQFQQGTSFSAPFVAGVAASLLARSPENTTALELKAAILASAVPFNNVKARLVTDGYVDALGAFNEINNPKPLPVISKIEIDDTGITGNGNGLVDIGESVTLNVTVDLIGAKANSMLAILRSSSLTALFKSTDSFNLPVFNKDEFQYGQVVLSFDGVSFNNFYQAQNVAFELYLTSYFGNNANDSVSYVRYFTIDTGSLVVDTPVTNKLRLNDDEQDEVHYYYFLLERNKGKLLVNLTVNEITSDIDILLKYGSPPQFSYAYYDDESLNEFDRYDSATIVGVENKDGETATVKNPIAGIYHIAVIGNGNRTNMEYSLSVSIEEKEAPVNAFGCSLGQISQQSTWKKDIDPLFYILCMLSLWKISRFRVNSTGITQS